MCIYGQFLYLFVSGCGYYDLSIIVLHSSLFVSIPDHRTMCVYVLRGEIC